MTVSSASGPRLSLPRWCAGLAALAGVVSLVAAAWDDSWHTDIGRDSALVPPHLLLYGAVAVAGIIVAGWAVSVWARTGSVAAMMRQPGLVLCALGGVATLLAAPLDAGWHSAFGRDAVLWSPPHMLAVLASVTMLIGVLVALRPGRRGLLEAALAAAVLGALLSTVMEFDSDVPQFPEGFYLPVLLAASLFGAAVVRHRVPLSRPVTAVVVVAVVLRGVTVAVLALAGRSTPDLPVAIVGLCVLDLRWRSSWRAWSATAAAVAALAWFGSALGVSSVPAQAVAPGAALALLVAAIVVLATTVWGRPAALAVTTLAAAAALLGLDARPALAHDPGQGTRIGDAVVTGVSDGRGGLALTVQLSPGACSGATVQRVLARRAGETVTGALLTTGSCRYSGGLRVPLEATGGSRWFTYAEYQVAGRPAELWMPLEAAQPASTVATRELYRPSQAGPTEDTLETVLGAAIYAVGVALLIAALWYSRRPSPRAVG